MMYDLNLPAATRERLHEVMELQFRILKWAASAPAVNRGACEVWLQAQADMTAKRATLIAGWLWGTTYKEQLGDNLAKFAAGGTPEGRTDWVAELYMRVSQFEDASKLDGEFPQATKASSWEQGGFAYLYHMYDPFGQGFPAYLFQRYRQAGPFSRRDFLDAFVAENKHLSVCAACEEAHAVERVGGALHGIYDHFLPRSKYPHLSVHPYNLVPVCGNCNSLAKRDLDPLAAPAGRLRLEQVWLPYRHVDRPKPGLSLNSRLEVINLVQFASVTSEDPTAAIDIEVFGRVFELPLRWDQHVGKITQLAMQRIADSARPFQDSSIEQLILHGYADELIAEMVDPLGQLPFAYTQLWWIAHKINVELEKLQRAGKTAQPLAWNGLRSPDAAKMAKGAAIRNRVAVLAKAAVGS